MISIVNGSILDSKEKFICHATNCVTKHAAGLAKDMFDKFPYANIYSSRDESDVPGTIVVCGDGLENRYVINMLSQYYPGKPKFPNSQLDGSYTREKYFKQALFQISKLDKLESVAFPYMIGCGLAGGIWSNYYNMILDFESYVDEKYNTKVVIYKNI